MDKTRAVAWITVLALLNPHFAVGGPCDAEDLISRLKDSPFYREQERVAKLRQASDKQKVPVVQQNISFDQIPEVGVPDRMLSAAIKQRLNTSLNNLGADGDFYIVVDRHSNQVRIVSSSMSDREIAAIAKNIDPKVFGILKSQAKTKINQHIRVTLAKTGNGTQVRQLKFVRPDQSQVVEEALSGSIPTVVRANDFGISEKSGTRVAVSAISPDGEGHFIAANEHGFVDWKVIESYEPQTYTTVCGLASTCAVAVAVEGGQRSLLSSIGDVKDPRVVTSQVGSNPGLTLDELGSILTETRGVAKVQTRKAIKIDQKVSAEALEKEVMTFRRDIMSSLEDPKTSLVVNFDGKTMGGATGGHFSPIAAYDPTTDRVLIADVALHKNEAFWIPVEDLYHAMRKLDSGTGSARGYHVVTRADDVVSEVGEVTAALSEGALGKKMEQAITQAKIGKKQGEEILGFIDNARPDKRHAMIKRFKNQSVEQTAEDLRTIRDLRVINGPCI